MDLIDDLEVGEIPTEEEAGKVRDLIEALGGVPETEHLQPPQPEQRAHDEPEHQEDHGDDEPTDVHFNGCEERFVGDNAG